MTLLMETDRESVKVRTQALGAGFLRLDRKADGPQPIVDMSPLELGEFSSLSVSKASPE